MGKEYEDAVKEVKSRSHSVAELVALVKSMSGNLEQSIDGTVTHLLYSGSIVAGDESYSASSVANSLRMNGVNVRHVGDSHVGKLLSDVNFKYELESAIQREYPNESPEKLAERFNNILYGTTKQSGQTRRLDNALSINNGSPSLWDIASHSYVSQAEGHFRIIALEINEHSVLAQSEIPAFFSRQDQNATLEGMSQGDLKVAYESGYGGKRGEEAVRLMLQDEAAYSLRASSLSLYDGGKPPNINVQQACIDYFRVMVDGDRVEHLFDDPKFNDRITQNLRPREIFPVVSIMWWCLKSAKRRFVA